MVALISLAAKVAKADGKVTRAEIQSFDRFLQQNLRMGTEERKIAARIFNEARGQQHSRGGFRPTDSRGPGRPAVNSCGIW